MVKDKNGVELKSGDYVINDYMPLKILLVIDYGMGLCINDLPVSVYRMKEDGTLIDFVKSNETYYNFNQIPISNIKIPTKEELDMLPECCKNCSNNIYNNPNGGGVCCCSLPYNTYPIKY